VWHLIVRRRHPCPHLMDVLPNLEDRFGDDGNQRGQESPRHMDLFESARATGASRRRWL
jgi:hypothetical protein